MKLSLIIVFALFISSNLFADLKYYPIQFKLSTDKKSYYEGEKITILITIRNSDKDHRYPVLLPHTQNVGQKLFYLNLYDKANNTLLLRATEEKMMNMMVHDTGSVRIKYLEPLEEIVIPVYWNDSENYYSYHTQNSSHHSFGVPVFAGLYKLNVSYNPYGLPLGDSIYSYYDDFEEPKSSSKLAMSNQGYNSNMVELRIKRSADTLVSIERINYYIKTDGHRYFYYSEEVSEIISDLRLIHVTNLPLDSFSITNEYFYSHFVDNYAEYVTRFEDGDIKEYRKYRDVCPDYLYTEKFNNLKQKVFFACQLSDLRFYSITYAQPTNRIEKESYCSADGKVCDETTFVYNKKGILVRKKTIQYDPCLAIQLENRK